MKFSLRIGKGVGQIFLYKSMGEYGPHPVAKSLILAKIGTILDRTNHHIKPLTSFVTRAMASPVYVHVLPGDIPPLPNVGRPFKAIYVIEADASSARRDAVADWLVQSGCRYLMAWGQECEEWHDSVDSANLRAFNNSVIPDDDFVMTTWHANEPLSDVFWYSEHAAIHPTLSLEKTCIVHIAFEERAAELLDLFLSAQDTE